PLEPKFKFMQLRKLMFGFSIASSLAVVGLAYVKDFNYGIDFMGGSLIEVQAKGPQADSGDVRARLSDLNLGEIQVQAYGERELMIRLQTQEGDNAEQSAMQLVRDTLGADYDFRRIEVVGPTVSGELALTGVLGILLSMIGMLIYIWLRFEW